MNYSINTDKFQKALTIAKMIFNVVLIISGLLLVYWILNKVYNTFFRPNSETVGTLENNQVKTEQTVKNDIVSQTSKGAKATYTDSGYAMLANHLFSKFGVFSKATYEDVYPVLTKLKSTLDFLKLKDAFGLRDIDGYGLAKPMNLDEAFLKGSDYKANAFYQALQTSFQESKSLTKK